jgi:hypothetical protein
MINFGWAAFFLTTILGVAFMIWFLLASAVDEWRHRNLHHGAFHF